MADTTGMVKVGLRAPDGEFETMWATPAGLNRYRLENSPFYAYGVSWLDIVEAIVDDEGGIPIVQRRLERSGHRTVRLILVPGVDEQPERQRVLDDLNALGCTYEGYNPRYFSIDIPPGTHLEPVTDYLTRAGHEWEYVDPTYNEVYGAGSSGIGDPDS
jgi:uncharacterized protein DUF4265